MSNDIILEYGFFSLAFQYVLFILFEIKRYRKMPFKIKLSYIKIYEPLFTYGMPYTIWYDAFFPIKSKYFNILLISCEMIVWVHMVGGLVYVENYRLVLVCLLGLLLLVQVTSIFYMLKTISILLSSISWSCLISCVVTTVNQRNYLGF